MATTPVPPFAIRWAEPLSGARTRIQSLSANLRGESSPLGPAGHVAAETKDMLGALPAGTHRGNAHMIRDAAAAAPVEALWRQIKRDRVEQWLQPVGADAGRLRRNELELVVRPGSSSERAYRVSLENASQPIQDLLAATAKLHTDTRM